MHRINIIDCWHWDIGNSVRLKQTYHISEVSKTQSDWRHFIIIICCWWILRKAKLWMCRDNLKQVYISDIYLRWTPKLINLSSGVSDDWHHLMNVLRKVFMRRSSLPPSPSMSNFLLIISSKQFRRKQKH